MLKVTHFAQGGDTLFDVLAPEVDGTNIASLLGLTTIMPRFRYHCSESNTGNETGGSGEGFLSVFHNVSNVVSGDVNC